MPGPTIVVADDDADDRMLINDAFEECEIGNPVCFVYDGEELMEYLRRVGPYDKLKGTPYPGLILLDLNMPRKDGVTALREIRSDPDLRNIPVVILTTTKTDDAVDQIYGLGANSFITKPMTFENLCEAISVLCRYWTDIVAIPASCRSSGFTPAHGPLTR